MVVDANSGLIRRWDLGVDELIENGTLANRLRAD